MTTTAVTGLLPIILIFLLGRTKGIIGEDPQTLCPFNQSVVVTANENGTYIFEDSEIPSNLVFTTSWQNATTEMRVCICKIKRCLPVCSSDIAETYNLLKDKDIDAVCTKNITLNNGTTAEMNLMTDFHRVVKPLECPDENWSYLNPDIGEEINYTLYENGDLLDKFQNKHMEFCFDIEFQEWNGIPYFFMDPKVCYPPEFYWDEVITGCGMLVSVPFFLLSIVFYSCASMRVSVHAKCMVPYLGSLAVSYSLSGFLKLSSVELPELECVTMGYVNYFCVTSYLIWNCIISYDVWYKCTRVVMKASSRFLRYSILGSVVPLAMTALTYAAQNSEIQESLLPGINAERCSIDTGSWSALIYLYGPCIAALTFSIVLYVHVLYYMRECERSTQVSRDTLMLSVRLFILMCSSWLCDVISYFLKMFWQNILLYMIPDILNAMQVNVNAVFIP
uniref:Methuselah N-terminal domain-containing protein n=1 Tax=Musca domestica TaxID=7370 RepID=A0A1I8NJD8_MUSDO